MSSLPSPMQPSLRLIDTHTHLHLIPFDTDGAAVLARAAAAGVQHMIEIGYDLPSSRTALALAAAHAPISAVVGIQPNHVHELPSDWQAQLYDLLRQPNVVALGEIGLDYHWMKAPPEQQAAIFREQLAMARELDLPVVIHCREAAADTLAVLRADGQGVRGVMHSFSGDWAFAEACLELGFLLSFSGPVTFPKAKDLHTVVQRVPATALLAETDTPYLTPHPHRGERNEPAYVRYVVERIAALRGETAEAVSEQIWQNAQTIFRPVHT